MRIAAEKLTPPANRPSPSCCARPRSRRAARSPRRLIDQRLLEDRAHRLARIERAVRVLEHHLHRQTDGFPPLGPSPASAVVSPSISKCPMRRRLQQGRHARQRRLAAAGFADHRQRLALARARTTRRRPRAPCRPCAPNARHRRGRYRVNVARMHQDAHGARATWGRHRRPLRHQRIVAARAPRLRRSWARPLTQCSGRTKRSAG